MEELEDLVIPDATDDLTLPKGRYSESFVLISSLEVFPKWGVKKGGTWTTSRVPDLTHG